LQLQSIENAFKFVDNAEALIFHICTALKLIDRAAAAEAEQENNLFHVIRININCNRFDQHNYRERTYSLEAVQQAENDWYHEIMLLGKLLLATSV